MMSICNRHHLLHNHKPGRHFLFMQAGQKSDRLLLCGRVCVFIHVQAGECIYLVRQILVGAGPFLVGCGITSVDR